MPTLAEIRANIRAQEDQKSNNSTFSGDLFPHWKINDGESCKIRFLPDANENNPFGFYLERLMINLSFSGIKGEAGSKPVVVKVPCMEMWEEVGSCPILAEIRPWFKANDKALEDMARKYWKKRSYFMQGFVIEKPAGLEDEENIPENPIRRFTFTPQIHDIVKAALMDPEMEELPTDYESGLDFVVNKTAGTPYSSYATSKYVRKETALDQVQRDAIDEYGLNDLSSFLPKKPDAEHLAIQKEMFEASIDGELYDSEKWGAFYRPQGVAAPTTPEAANSETKTKETKAKETKVEETVVEKVEETVVEKVEEKAVDSEGPNQKAQDLLAKIRNRTSA